MTTPALTTTGLLALTDAETKYLSSFLSGVHDRADFYLAYFNMTGNDQALEQLKIATFSQSAGGTAYMANLLLELYYGQDKYAGIYFLSEAVAERGLQAIQDDITAGGTGAVSDGALFNSASQAWNDNGEGNQFPGNLLTGTEQLSQWITENLPQPPTIPAVDAVNGLFDVLKNLLSAASVNAAGYQSFTDYIFSLGSAAAFLAPFLSSYVSKQLSDYSSDPHYKIVETPDGKFSVAVKLSNNKIVGMFDNSVIPTFKFQVLQDLAAFAGVIVPAALTATAPALELFLEGWSVWFRTHLSESATPFNGEVNPRIPETGGGPVTVPLGTGGDSQVSGTTGQTIWGTGGVIPFLSDDNLTGTSGNDAMFGGSGDDVMDGSGGNDIIYGQEGKDVITGGAGDDTVRGGAGDDRIFGDTGNDVLDGGDATTNPSGNDYIDGGADNDFITGGDGQDTLIGGTGADTIYGGADNDTIYGGSESKKDSNPDKAGNDELHGGTGDDEIYGAAGNDVLFGDDGDDTLAGGHGNDDLEGGIGTDTYLWYDGDGLDKIDDVWESGGKQVQSGGTMLGKIKINDVLISTAMQTDKPIINGITWYKVDGTNVFIGKKAVPGTDYYQLWINDSGDPTGTPGFLVDAWRSDGDLGLTLKPNKKPKSPNIAPPTNGTAAQRRDPLILDLSGTAYGQQTGTGYVAPGAAGTGIQTVGLAEGLHFDQDDDGFAEGTGWAAPGSGMLVLDVNGDGILDSGNELFGNFTPLGALDASGKPLSGQYAANGFQALSQFDRNGDGKIDASDPIWTQLKVWVYGTDDQGATIVADPTAAGELISLGDLGITAISLTSNSVNATTLNAQQAGNVVSRAGTFEITDISGTRSQTIAEVQLQSNPGDTYATNLPTLEDARIAGEPDLDGGSSLLSLHQAMQAELLSSSDGTSTIQTLLDQAIQAPDISTRSSTFQELLFKWAGVDGVSSTYGSGFGDGQEIAFLEKYYGVSYGSGDVNKDIAWDQTFERLSESLYASFVAQTSLSSEFDAATLSYDQNTGQLLSADYSAVVPLLEQSYQADPTTGLQNIQEFMRALRGYELNTDISYLILRETIVSDLKSQIPDIQWLIDTDGYQAAITEPGQGDQRPGVTLSTGHIYGTENSDAIRSNFVNPNQAPGSGQNLVNGEAGDDVIYLSSSESSISEGGNSLVIGGSALAGAGDDTLEGGAGNDTLQGEAGNDTYIFRRGSGNDLIVDSGGRYGETNTLFLAGLTADDIYIYRLAGSNNIVVGITNTTDTINFASGDVSRIAFQDGTIWDAQILADKVRPVGTPGNDTLLGTQADDSINGLAGDDFIDAGLGNNTVTGGLGNDTILASDGQTTYVFNRGDGQDIVDSQKSGPTTDILLLGDGISPDDVHLSNTTATIQTGSNQYIHGLLVTIGTGGDSVFFQNQFTNPFADATADQYGIGSIEFSDGTIWDNSKIISQTEVGTIGNDVLQPWATQSNNQFVGLAGGDTLEGGLGNTTFDGGPGNDNIYVTRQEDATSTVLFGFGDGHDTVSAGDPTKLILGAGVTTDDIKITKDDWWNAYVTLSDGSSIELSNWFITPTSGLGVHDRLDEIDFADGTVWDLNKIVNSFSLTGTPGADTLYGWGDAQTITGAGGDDLIYSGGGSDSIDGGDGNDTIYAGDGLYYVDGVPVSASPTVQGGAGDDLIYGGKFTDDLISGGDGNDTIIGNGGNDTIDGGAGDDVIYSADPSAPFYTVSNPGASNFPLGSATYLFGHGDGHDTIKDLGAINDADKIQFKADVGPGQVSLTQNGQNLVVTLTDSGDSITVVSQFGQTFAGGISYQIESLVFADGTVWNADEILRRSLLGTPGDDGLTGGTSNDLIIGGAGNDVLNGGLSNDGVDGDDTLIGGTGDDYLFGGGGTNTYVFSSGDGHDVMDSHGYSPNDASIIQFDSSISESDVTIRQVNGQEVISIGTDQQITDIGFGLSNTNHEIQFSDGMTWDFDTEILKSTTGGAGDDRLESIGYASTFDGMGGNDTLIGGGGADTFLFGRGDGQDTIQADNYLDRIDFKAGVSEGDVSYALDGTDLLISIVGTTDNIRVVDWNLYGESTDSIGNFQFSNGTVLDRAGVESLLNLPVGDQTIFGTPGDDLLVATDANTTILADSGNDTLIGGTGFDYLDGQDGDDSLVGGLGQDTLYGGSGQNTLLGGADDDTLVSDGNDYLDGGAGNDHIILNGANQGTIYFARGSGIDDVDTSPDPSNAGIANYQILLGPGITIDDITVQTVSSNGGGYGGYGGYGGGYGGSGGGSAREIAIGIGNNEVLEINAENGSSSDVTQGAVAGLEFADGTTLSLNDLISRADGGVIGFQAVSASNVVIKGSALSDSISVYGSNDSVSGGDNNDTFYATNGSDIIDAGNGDDTVFAGVESVVAGGKGDDRIGGNGDDTYAYNRGDGHDAVSGGTGNTLSLGAGISLSDLTAYVDESGNLAIRVAGSTGDQIDLSWFDRNNGLSIDQPAVTLLQLVDASGNVRVFNLASWTATEESRLAASSEVRTVSLADELPAYELTGSVIPAGGNAAVAYAETGNLFGTATYSASQAGTAGNDLIIGADGGSVIDAGAGNDLVAGGNGADDILGGTGNDTLSGGWGNDTLEGGGGDDLAIGGSGDDTYIFNVGDGRLTIQDQGDSFGGNTLAFGAGITLDALTVTTEAGYLVLKTGTPGDEVRLSGFDPTDPFETVVDTFTFDDGDEIDYSDLLARGVQIDGTNGNDNLVAPSYVPTFVSGGNGDDIITAGGGDTVDGGAGNDTYLFVPYQGGQMVIRDDGGPGQNTIQFQDGIYESQVSAKIVNGKLTIQVGYSDQIVFDQFDPTQAGAPLPVANLQFADGSSVTLAQLLVQANIGITGTPGDDVLRGTSGNDLFHGMGGNDVLVSNGGADTFLIDADGGTDTIGGATGGGDFNKVVFTNPYASLAGLSLRYDESGGDLIVSDGQGSNVALGDFDRTHPLDTPSVGLFEIQSTGQTIDYADLLQRGINITGTPGNDTLVGTATTDFISGGAGDDLIESGPGNDIVDGGAGDDTYVYNLGDGVLTIQDTATPGEGNTLQFGAGITAADLARALRFESPDSSTGDPGSLIIKVDDAGDEIRMEGFDPTDALDSAHAIDTFRFADGSSIDYRDLVNDTFVLQGDDSDNELIGASVGTRLYGFGGFDTLIGGAGDDVLTGGTGDDQLYGGAGQDAYVFNLGDGQDTIHDAAEGDISNIITFEGGITKDDVRTSVSGTTLTISYGNVGDTITVLNYDPTGVNGSKVVDGFEFPDGTTLTMADLVNSAPVASATLSDQSLLQGQSLNYILPADAFSDPDGDVLKLTATLANGMALPSWLSFDAKTSTFSGVPENVDVGSLQVAVFATDTHGAQVSQTFGVAVTNVNDAPALNNPIGDQSTAEGDNFQLTVDLRTFIDPDIGDSVAYSMSETNGDALPDWLSFDPATLQLSGTPARANVGTLSLEVIATDKEGLSANTTFQLTVAPVDEPPTVTGTIGDQSIAQDQAFSLSIPVSMFDDPDISYGDNLSYFATTDGGDSLPGWLTFDASTMTLSGTPGNFDVGTTGVTFTAVDLAGKSVSTAFQLTVTNINDAPMLLSSLQDIQAEQGAPVNFAVPADTFFDIDQGYGDILSYSASQSSGGVLPSWLSFDPVTQAFSGTPPVGGSYVLQVTATDAQGAIASSSFTLTVHGNTQNQPPVVVDDSATVAANDPSAATGNVLANDSDPDAGTILAVAGPGTYTGTHGTLTLAADGSYSYVVDSSAADLKALSDSESVADIFQYSATDNDNTNPLATAGTLTVTIQGVNDAPVTSPDAGAVSEDGTLTVGGNVLSNDTDVDHGSILSVAAPGTYAGTYGSLVLAADGTYTYSLANSSSSVQSLAAGQTVTDAFAYNAQDNGQVPLQSVGILTITVTGTNDAPVTVGDAAGVQEDGTISATGNALTNDSDVDQGTVLMVADPGTYTGTYGNLVLGANGSYTYTLNNAGSVVQSLRGGQQVQDTFSYGATDGIATTNSSLVVTVTGTNDAPVTVADTAAVQEDGTLTATGNVLANDSDVDQGTTLSVAAPGTYTGTYGSLVLNANGTYTYTLNNSAAVVQSLDGGQQVHDTFAYGASDGTVTTAGSLTVTVTGTNDAPVTVADAAAAKEDTTLTASGNVLTNDSDVDQGTTLTVAAPGTYTGAYGSVVIGANGAYTYILNNAGTAVQSLRGGQQVHDTFAYSASDGTASTAGSLVVTVIGTNDAPVTSADSGAVQEDTTLAVSGNVLANDTDPDQGTTLSVAAPGTFTGTYGTLVLNANGAYTYTLNNSAGAVQSLAAGQHVTDVFTYGAKDDDASPLTTNGTLTITVTGTNDAPVLATAMSNQSDLVGAAFSYTLPAGTFTDVDQGDSLSYSAGVLGAGGTLQALPAWLTFNAATHTFSGTPASGDVATYQLQVTATDTSGAHTAGTFSLTVSGSTAGTTLNGTSGNDTLNGGAGNDTINGNAGNDFLYGNAGDDSLNGGTGADLLSGGDGNDTLAFSNDAVWNGSTTNRGSPGVSGSGVSVNLGGKQRTYDVYDGGAGNDTFVGTSSSDVLLLDDSSGSRPAGTSGARIINVETFNLGGGEDVLDLTSTTYTYGDVSVDAGDGNDVVWSSAGNDVLEGGNGDDTLDGGAGNDLLEGGVGNDNLTDSIGTGNDIDQGMTGDDTILDMAGSNALTGGSGNDTITDGSGASFVAGGTGNDTVNLGKGADVYAFNKGDGKDAVTGGSPTSPDATISLGGGIELSDLTLTKQGNDLWLNIGSAEQITLVNWYAGNKDILNLQIVEQAAADFNPSGTDTLRNQDIETFNFAGIVSAFDTARASNQNLNNWAVTNAVAQFHLSGSNTQAIGGDLAYQYGLTGNLTGIGLTHAQEVINDTSFGTQAQTLRPLASIQEGTVKLS